jgi:hypothetical protein
MSKIVFHEKDAGHTLPDREGNQVIIKKLYNTQITTIMNYRETLNGRVNTMTSEKTHQEALTPTRQKISG